MKKIFYIKDGMLHVVDGGKGVPVPDGVYEGYKRRMTDAATRNEWKTQGSGAKFMGTFDPASDFAAREASIRPRVYGVRAYKDKLLFSEAIGDTAAIYRKLSVEDRGEVVALSDTSLSLTSFDISGDRAVLAAEGPGYSHIALAELGERSSVREITEGECFDANPTFDACDPNVIYYESAGVYIEGEKKEEDEIFMTPSRLMEMMSGSFELGPSSIVRLDMNEGSLDYLLEGGKFSFVKPQSDSSGKWLYYIEKPYEDRKNGSGGCLLDLILLPVRILSALFGFFNFFSMKYSGSALSNNGTKSKQRNQKEIVLDGNLINAEKAMKENAKDENPGVVPKSYKLCRMNAKGEKETVRGGVIAYTIADNGDVYCSNGKHILKITKDGREERVLTEDNVTYLAFVECE